MKTSFRPFRLLSLWLGILVLAGGCDAVMHDVVPRSFQDFTLYPDEIYLFNGNTGFILRLDPLANDSIKAKVTLTYSQPEHGKLHPDFDGPGTMGYTPDQDFFGEDNLTYMVCNGETCKTEKIKLIVEKPYDPSTCTTVLGPDVLETTRNTPKGIRIFLNDIICYNDTYGGLTIWKPEKGTYRTIDYSGSYKNTIYVYYPPKDFVGQDSFRYRVFTSRDRSSYLEEVVQVTVK